ncbi:MAG: 4Fe-4S dicluster domain-containing protein [Bacteroidales bacterium]|nr:4Fe-4S dicluster domain-containing protein [Bacteroidales bacterium]
MRPIFDPFVLPFVISMTFVLLYCIIGMIRIIFQLPKEDRRKFLRSLIYPKSALKNFRDLVNDCLFHTKIWKRKPLLGYMHMSIALGWFMIIIVGHFESITFSPLRGLEVPFMQKMMSNLYLPIFFRYFAIEELSLKAQIFSFLMDFFLLMIISGIFIAVVKKKKPKKVGMKRVTKFGIKEDMVRLSLWTIFPLRFLAESSIANIAGGSFLTKYLGFELVFGGNYNETLSMVFWWLYSIDLAIFMTLLPFSRYMHIPAEALLILLRNAGLKTTEPRKGYAVAEIYSCPSCGLCIDVCPMSEVKDNYKNTAVYFIRNIRKGKRRRDVKNMTEKCLMCGKCIEVCPLGIESLNIKIAQRKKTYYKIKSDFSYLERLQDYKTTRPQDDLSAHSQKTLYFAGCMSHLTPKITRSMTKIFKLANENFEFLDADGSICCGRPMMLTGKINEAKALIAKNTELIKKSGAKKLVLSCPICYKVFKEEYQLDGIEILHHTQYINELIENDKLNIDRSDKRYAYHDPCELGRAFGIYDEPRNVIDNIGLLTQGKSDRDMSACCGGSIGSLTMSMEERDEITKNTIKDLTLNQPDEIVTACPLCLKTFARLSPIEVKDIAEIVVEGLEG